MRDVTCSKCNTDLTHNEETIVENWCVCINCKSIIDVETGREMQPDEWLDLELERRKELNYLLTLADKEKTQELIKEIYNEIGFFKELIQSNIQAVPIDNMVTDMFEYFVLVRPTLSVHNQHLFCSVLGMMEFFRETQKTHKEFKKILDDPEFEKAAKEIFEKLSPP
jgi:hypothetical protein